MPQFDPDVHFWKQGEVDNLTLGSNGAKIVTDTSATTGSFYAIAFVEAGVFSALTGTNLQGTWTGVTFPAGFVLYGRFSAFTLSSGKVVAYRFDVDGV